MRCFVDNANMVNIFWSEKCGCTYLKSLYNYYIRGVDMSPHTKEWAGNEEFQDPNGNRYKNILIVRNPYHRIISGFYDKYVDGNFSFTLNKPTFKEFVNILETKPEIIDYDHFSPQFSRAYYNELFFDVIYDIDSFDEKDFLNNFKLKSLEYNPTINISKSYYKNDHTNEKRIKIYVKNAYDLSYTDLCYLKRTSQVPLYSCFYNDIVKKQVEKIYSVDFINLEKYGIHYTI